jgi:hypothetical protein
VQNLTSSFALLIVTIVMNSAGCPGTFSHWLPQLESLNPFARRVGVFNWRKSLGVGGFISSSQSVPIGHVSAGDLLADFHSTESSLLKQFEPFALSHSSWRLSALPRSGKWIDSSAFGGIDSFIILNASLNEHSPRDIPLALPLTLSTRERLFVDRATPNIHLR